MKTIWKYEIPVADEFGVAMQQNAQILCVQTQNGHPYIWAVVDPATPREVRRFAVRGTGHALGNVGKYIGTFQLRGGALVFHLFESE